MHIAGGRWRNAAGMEWGVIPERGSRGERRLDYLTSLPGLPGVYQVFAVAKDCVYWQQNKCGEEWAEDCKIYATSVTPHGEVRSFRFLSEVYYREGY